MTEYKSIYNFKDGVKDGLPIGLGYLSVSFGFGVKASLLGLPVIMTVLISMTNLTSAGQLAGVEIIAALGTVIEIILSQAVINSRYFLMSITLSQKLDDGFTLPYRLLCAAGVTDEIFAVAAAKKQPIGKTYFLGLMLLPYIGWSLGTLLGAIAGNILPVEIQRALGISLYAMFTAIIIPPCLENKGIFAVVILATAISCALYFIPWFNGLSNGFAYIITAIIASAVIAYFFPVKEESDDAVPKESTDL